MNKYVLTKIKALQSGEIIISKEAGNSMLPILKSKEPVVLVPVTDFIAQLKPGDIAFAKIHGCCYTHKVYGVNPDKGILIGNNSGHMNGWTKNIYGKAYLIPRDRQNDLNGYLEEFINSYQQDSQDSEN